MTACLRCLVVLAVAAAVGPAFANAQAPVASGDVEPVVRPTTLSAHLATLAYSAYDPGSDSYRLRVRSAPSRLATYR